MINYTYKHLLFAIREEYQSIQKQKEQLKKYVTKSKFINDYRFDLTVNKGKNIPKLFLEFELREKVLQKCLRSILGGAFNNSKLFDITNGFSENDKYNVYKREKNYFYINDEQKLNDLIKGLVQSDYIQERLLDKRIGFPLLEHGKKHLEFNWNYGLNFVDDQDPYYDKMEYDIYEDKIYIENYKKNICKEDIMSMLNYKIDISKMNNYYQKLLENGSDKTVVIDSVFNSNQARLSILETPKEYVLTNKR